MEGAAVGPERATWESTNTTSTFARNGAAARWVASGWVGVERGGGRRQIEGAPAAHAARGVSTAVIPLPARGRPAAAAEAGAGCGAAGVEAAAEAGARRPLALLEAPVSHP